MSKKPPSYALARKYGLPAGISDRDAAHMARCRDAYHLRIKGKTYQQVSDAMGIPLTTVKDMCDKWRAALPLETTAEHMQLEADRYEELISTYMPSALEGSADAADMVIKLSDRKAKLYGLTHADRIASRQVDLEEAKAKLVAIALRRALEEASLTPTQVSHVQERFLEVLQAPEKPVLL